METQETICRLCLKMCDSFKALEGTMKGFLDKLLPKINLAAVMKPVVCTNCAEMLKKCFDFKAMCKIGHDNIVPFIKDKDAFKMDVNRNENGSDVPEDQDICGFCMSSIQNCSPITPHVESEDVMLKKMMKQCLPELDLSFTKPRICVPCRESLEMFFRFVMNCLMVEEKIKKYCETVDINNTSQVELSSLLQLTTTDLTTVEVDGNLVDIVKREKPCEEIENADEREIDKGCDIIKLEQMYYDDSRFANEEIKHEGESYMDMTDLIFNNLEQCTPNNVMAYKESDSLDVIKIEEKFYGVNENLVEMEAQKFLLSGEIDIKTDESDFNRFEDGVASSYAEVATEVKKYKCDSCSFQTIYKGNLKSHVQVHKDSSNYLKRHLLVHKDPSEITMYKCDSCAFQSKHKGVLEKHLLVHKNPSEVTMHKCDSCLFQSKHKTHLKEHLLVHASNAKMYKCDSCSFQTKYKRGIKKHFLLLHKELSEVTMYKCDSCSYQTNSNSNLKKHLLVHRNPSEVTMFKCDSCSYQTKAKANLKKHLLVHRDPSEVTMFKCDSCLFLTKRKASLKKHLLVHQNPSEVTIYKCGSCSYQTKSKDTLMRHMLVHRNPSEVTVYKCNSCSFQSKHVCSLKRHLLRHMCTRIHKK